MIDLKEVFKQQPACETDSKKLKAVLNDLYPEEKALTKVLVDVFESGIASEVKTAKGNIDSITMQRYKDRLENEYCYSPKFIKQTLDIVLSTYDKQNNCATTIPTEIKARATYNLADFEIENGILKRYNKRKGKNVVIPNNVASIGNSVFSGYSELKNVTIPDSVISIGEFAFYGCRGLTNLTMGNCATNIGYHAFCGCSGLTNVTVPNSMTSIGSYAFSRCNELTSITYKGTKTEWSEISKGYGWKNNVPTSCVVHCTDGDVMI